jgi:hypothetical protein
VGTAGLWGPCVCFVCSSAVVVEGAFVSACRGLGCVQLIQ